MKVCTICGAQHERYAIRCSVCHALLPDVEISDPPISNNARTNVKICKKCGQACHKNAVRCDKCGGFLDDERTHIASVTEQTVAPLLMRISSGETFTLMSGGIIGRQYQPQLWDAYTSRAAYRIGFSDGKYVLEDLNDSSVIPITFETEYKIGRKKIIFCK